MWRRWSLPLSLSQRRCQGAVLRVSDRALLETAWAQRFGCVPLPFDFGDGEVQVGGRTAVGAFMRQWFGHA